MIFSYLSALFVRMCGTIDPSNTYDEYLVLAKKIGYDRSGTRAVSTVGTLA
jgi:hypothetical protein